MILYMISLLLVGCEKETSSQKTKSNSFENFKIPENFRGWQGVAVDEKHIYIFTDRNIEFELENVISLYTHEGTKVGEYKDLYKEKDSQGKSMSFGDGNLIEGKIYITAYNIHSGGRPTESRVLVYSVPDIKLIKMYEIGEGVAESVTKYMDHYWVTYHDQMIIKQFDSSFDLIRAYTLSEKMGEYGGYQGAYWENDNIFIQMHGPNKLGQISSKGLDRYKFNGNEFVYLKTEKPLSYGSGQGVATYGEYIFQNDRPSNSVFVRSR